MHSEGDIRRAIRPLLDLYGELSTTEIKKNIEEVLTFDSEDLEMSSTRNETKIIQRIGNIVAHQNQDKKIYPEGFMVDKTLKPAMFYPVTGLSDKLKPLDEKTRKAKKKKAVQGRKQRIAKKRDYLAEQENHSELGALGEEFVYEREREEVATFDESAVGRVIHLSREQGDGFGYDISSLNKKGEPIYIEVKTTEGKIDTPFFMTKREREFFEENKSSKNVFLYRVFEFNKSSRHGKIKKITPKELFLKYKFDPTTYRVTRKKR